MLVRPVSNAALWLISAVLVTAPVTFYGCSSAPLDAPESNPEPVPLEELAERLADALCEGLDACCQSAALGSAGADCRERTLADYQALLTTTSAGAVRYDPSAAARCVAAFTRFLQSCSYEGKAESDAACQTVFQGTRVVNESCASDAECAARAGAEMYCADDLGPQPNTCQPALGPDEQCLLEGCAEGLFCNLDTLSCVPQQSSGECFQFEACSEDSACSPSGACEPKLAAGVPCLLDLQCQTGVCGSDGLCRGSLANADTCTP